MARGLLLWQPSEGFAHREALGEYQRALSERPSFDEAWNQRGTVLFHIGHLDEALKSIERAIALNPGNLNARFRLAPIRMSQQQYEEAVAALRRVPRESYQTQWTYQLIWSLIALGRFDDASKEIEASLATSASDQGGVVHAARAMLRVKRGDRRGALADIDQGDHAWTGVRPFSSHRLFDWCCLRTARRLHTRAILDRASRRRRVSVLHAVRDRPTAGRASRNGGVSNLPRQATPGMAASAGDRGLVGGT